MSMWMMVIGIIGTLATSYHSRYKKGFHGKSTDTSGFQQIMIDALKSHDVEMSDEEMATMMEEVMATKKEAWKKK